jgi:hypothetical protein
MGILFRIDDERMKDGRKEKIHTKPNEMRQLARIIRHSSHIPISRTLPHGIQQSEEGVKPYFAYILCVIDVDGFGCCCTGVVSVDRLVKKTMNSDTEKENNSEQVKQNIPLVQVSPNMRSKDHDE